MTPDVLIIILYLAVMWLWVLVDYIKKDYFDVFLFGLSTIWPAIAVLLLMWFVLLWTPSKCVRYFIKSKGK